MLAFSAVDIYHLKVCFPVLATNPIHRAEVDSVDDTAVMTGKCEQPSRHVIELPGNLSTSNFRWLKRSEGHQKCQQGLLRSPRDYTKQIQFTPEALVQFTEATNLLLPTYSTPAQNITLLHLVQPMLMQIQSFHVSCANCLHVVEHPDEIADYLNIVEYFCDAFCAMPNCTLILQLAQRLLDRNAPTNVLAFKVFDHLYIESEGLSSLSQALSNYPNIRKLNVSVHSGQASCSGLDLTIS